MRILAGDRRVHLPRLHIESASEALFAGPTPNGASGASREAFCHTGDTDSGVVSNGVKGGRCFELVSENLPLEILFGGLI